jgi:hypothetical protein
MTRTLLVLLLAACTGSDPVDPPVPPPTPPTPAIDTVDTGVVEQPFSNEVVVTVTLDGAPVPDAWVSVGGGMQTWTDAAGQATVFLDGGRWIIASHPDARTRFTGANGATATVALERFDTADNPDYVFADPGVAGDPGNTGQCGHCHGSMVIDWTASPHRGSAANPIVHDVFAGTAPYADADSCSAAGGVWRTGLEPGTAASADRCYLGAGTLPDLNPDCGDTASCDGVAANTGGCADCHAPGIDGALGGRSLLEATGRAYTEGIHCDVCHKVASVDLVRSPGVGGALEIVRPTEPSEVIGFQWAPLAFGPYPDVPNPRMGAVPRTHFLEADFCAACHESVQTAQIPGEALDATRWPDGLPVHSTFSEWSAGPYAPGSPCQSCHMPPETRYGNSADLTESAPLIDVASGWFRPPGTVQRHTWDGPRGTGPLLGLAAAVDVQKSVSDGVLTATVTTTNVGAGHAIPTGEPMRSLVLVVEARCGSEPLAPTGGDVVPAFGGALDVRLAGEDWTVWPGASVGERIRVVNRAGFRDYSGPGPFGDGTFDVAAKGLFAESFAGERVITSVSGDAITLDAPLPAGDVAYRVDGIGLPADGESSRAWAGAPGFAFARILADSDGDLQVPHHRAVDIVSDNRILPQGSATTLHTFAATCADPEVEARLMHRPYPLSEVQLRGWDGRDQQMAVGQR